MKLTEQKCETCESGEQPLSEQEIETLRQQAPNWHVVDNGGIDCIERRFEFDNFEQALEFTVKVGELAESEDHHPSILTEWGSVTVRWWTHSVNGLHKNDFICAAKTNFILVDE